MPPPEAIQPVTLEERPGGVQALCFVAMGCPCEILVAGTDPRRAAACAQPGVEEARRIERKFSRYRSDSVVAAINASDGRPVPIDRETERLLEYAAQCHAMSQGRFDITCGVLRRAWTFDGSNRVPRAEDIEALLGQIGFGRIERGIGSVRVPAGMEIDLGGIAKEYAVDRALEILDAEASRGAGAVLVNFGGDLRAGAPPGAQPWRVGVEGAAPDGPPAMVIELVRGALATSGDRHRYVQRGARRYGHILDPRTGWPVADAPRSITVAASSCVEAGTLSTIAQLHGRDAEAFLDGLGATYWCQR